MASFWSVFAVYQDDHDSFSKNLLFGPVMSTQIMSDLMVSLVLTTDKTATSDVSSEDMMQSSEPQHAACTELVLQWCLTPKGRGPFSSARGLNLCSEEEAAFWSTSCISDAKWLAALGMCFPAAREQQLRGCAGFCLRWDLGRAGARACCAGLSVSPRVTLSSNMNVALQIKRKGFSPEIF